MEASVVQHNARGSPRYRTSTHKASTKANLPSTSGYGDSTVDRQFELTDDVAVRNDSATGVPRQSASLCT